MTIRSLPVLLVVSALLLSGCWDRIEVNDLAIATLVGVDRAEQGVKVTVNVMAPKTGGASSGAGGPARTSGQVVYSGVGRTIMDAMRRLQIAMPRRLFFGHTRILMIGRELAVDGIGPVIDFWSRDHEPRPLMRVAVVDGEAADLVMAEPKLEQQLSEAVRETINLRGLNRSRMKDLVIMLRSGAHPVLPLARMRAGPGPRPDIDIIGMAVFHGDQMIGTLSDAETRGLQWIHGGLDRSIVVATVAGQALSFEISHAHVSLRPQLVRGRLQLRLAATAEASLSENPTPLDASKEPVIHAIRSALEEHIRQRIAHVIARAQTAYRTDFLGFGDVVHQWLPVLWERDLERRWQDQFPAVPVVISVSCPVEETGAVTRTMTRP